ncbi:MAG: hypothetical protein R3B91_12825 [Planctomycetaceae bacterium]
MILRSLLSFTLFSQSPFLLGFDGLAILLPESFGLFAVVVGLLVLIGQMPGAFDVGVLEGVGPAVELAGDRFALADEI